MKVGSALFRRLCTPLVTAGVVLCPLVGVGAAEPAGTTAADSAAISTALANLASTDFTRREAASETLSRGGPAVIGPLVQAIKGADDLEVSTRGIEILQEMLTGDDEDAAAEAERELEQLCSHDDAAASRMAQATLEFHNVALAEESQAKLESLGANLEPTMLPDGRVGLHVTLNDSWTGTPDDLRLVSRLPQVLQVSIHGVRLEEQSIKELSRLRRIDQLALFNTDVSDELAARLATALPNTKVDVRRGGKLGVGGQPLLVPCVITQVQMGSAADKAGIQVGDVIRSFDGQKVESFEDLTNKIGAHGPGDEVAVGVERGGTVFEKTLALDGWQ
jgi:hypothetical protein